MPSFQITILNHEFESTIEQEASDLDEAKASGLKGALETGAEQVLAGRPFFGAEIIVTDGNIRERLLLAIGTSTLK